MEACNVFLRLVLKLADGTLDHWDINPLLHNDLIDKLINDVLDNIPHVDWYILEPLKQ